tara:strand:+ start:1552 stop:2070 length:519 start_codon:yes stop_codon:yes gene_type:complete
VKTRLLWSNFFLLLSVSLVLFLPSCSFVSNTNGVVKSKTIELNFRNSNWSKIDSDRADYAFKHDLSPSILVINSLCQKYDKTSLVQLTDNILAGLEMPKVLKQQNMRLFERASLRTDATGKLDGVKAHMLIQVVKKDRCIYDFVLITKAKTIDKSLSDSFSELVNTSRLGAR